MTTIPSVTKTPYVVPIQRKGPHYVVRPGAGIELTGKIAATPWEHALAMQIDQYPWYKDGKRQTTTLRVMYDTHALYLQFTCQDKHIFCETTELNGTVCLDSCVEFFATPNPEKSPHYFNFEANACGTMLVGWGAARSPRVQITPELAREITIATSVAGPTKDESPADDGWWLAARIPFVTLEKFTGQSIRPAKGTTWKANAYRCGGKSDSQFATWSWNGWPIPDFHRPQFFGQVTFE